MKKIQMVDLHGQYLKIKNEVDQAIQDVIDSTAFIRGQDVGQFQDELSAYLDVPQVIACGNGLPPSLKTPMSRRIPGMSALRLCMTALISFE